MGSHGQELYRAHFGTAPYSFDAGGVHFTAFDPTQPLLEPGHCGMAALDWLARDLGGLALGTPALMFQHFPVGGEHDFVDDQTALLELMARHDVRGLIGAGRDRRGWLSRGGRVDRRGRRRVPRRDRPGDRRVAWLWRTRLGPVYRRPGVGHAARTLFVPSADRHLYALDMATGLIRWRFAADAPVLSEPLAVTAGPDGYVVFSAGDRLLAVEAATGRLAWSVPGRGFSAGRAACDGERVYTAAADGYARAHDLRTGREAWSYPMVSGDRHRVTLYGGWDDVVMLGAGAVLVATVSGSQALDAATGTLRWTFPGSTMYPPAVPLHDGTVLLATERGVISRVDLADGRTVWQASLGMRVQNAGLAVAGDSAWVVSASGWLVQVRLADGDIAASVRLTQAHCYSAPAVVGDTLIAGDQDGLVHGIRLVS